MQHFRLQSGSAEKSVFKDDFKKSQPQSLAEQLLILIGFAV